MFERVERRGELAFAKIENGEIQQQADIVRSEDERLAILIDRVVGVAFGEQELRGGVMRRGNLLDGNCRARSRVGFELREIGEIDRIVVNGEAGDVFVVRAPARSAEPKQAARKTPCDAEE